MNGVKNKLVLVSLHRGKEVERRLWFGEGQYITTGGGRCHGETTSQDVRETGKTARGITPNRESMMGNAKKKMQEGKDSVFYMDWRREQDTAGGMETYSDAN